MQFLRLLKDTKIKHKLLVSNILYLILIVVVIYFFMSSSALMQSVSNQQKELNVISEAIVTTAMSVKDYVNNQISHEALKKQFDQVSGKLKGNELGKNIKSLSELTDRYNQLTLSNERIEADITQLTDASILASNTYIKKTSDRLIDPGERINVTDLERAVLVGASVNTSSNFRIKVLFLKIKEDLSLKNDLISFLDKLVENTKKDIEALKSTPFEDLPIEAQKANLAIHKLVNQYIENTQVAYNIQKELFKNIDTVMSRIEQIDVQASQHLTDTIKGNFSTIIIAILLVSLFGMALNFSFSKLISGSISRLILVAKDLAQGEGDLTKRLDVQSGDETGELAKWINLFVEKLHTLIKEISSDADSLHNSSSNLSTIAKQMADNSQQSLDNSHSVAGAAEEMSVNLNAVAAASEQASSNLNIVAVSSEELATTVKEIAGRSENGSAITKMAVDKANQTMSKVNELGDAAVDISKVTEAITEISEQTNLLALNATIEAARAGEAGKGFAVVANEIKELAKQTAEATSQIRAKINGIQQSSMDTVSEIESITKVITEVNDIVNTIAAAVEEQAVSTQEIAGNVSQASEGIKEVNQNVAQSSSVSQQIAKEVADVSNTASTLTSCSSQVNINGEELTALADKLHRTVQRFKI